MKRLLLLLVVCCTAFACEQNDAVPPQTTTKQVIKSKYRTLDEAIDIAEKSVSMLGEQTRATKRSINRSRVRAVLNKQAVTRSAAADTLIYIINFDDSAGFALVPRSTSKPELLAITEKGNYDGEETDNEGFNIYMDRAFEWIVDSTHDGQPVDTTFNPGVGGGGIGDQVITEWKSTSEYDSTKVSPKISVSWGQDVPYNYMCFYQGYFGGMPAKAGCVPIAIAQILSYYQHPSSITLSITFNNGSIIPLNWSQINKVYNSDDSEYGGGDYLTLAYLIREIGERVETTYGEYDNNIYDSSSGTQASNARSCFTSLGYSSGEYQVYNSSAVLNSLNQNNLVLIRGEYDNNASAGHAWVIDGYRRVGTRYKEWHRELGQVQWTLFLDTYSSNLHVHFNWGHEGYYNGYFLTSRSFTNYTTGATSSYTADIFEPSHNLNYDFNTNVKIIPNICPN